LKIALGFKLQTGPWGGGNNFAKSLVEYLNQKGDKVVFDLVDDDIDLILLTDPRIQSNSNCFTTIEILNYIQKINHHTLLIHRVNECDERKGTKYVNQQLAIANSFMDWTIYISSWLIPLFKNQNLIFTKNNSVILNGANSSIFKSITKKNIHTNHKIKIVTHHWGASYKKGWDIYLLLDNLLNQEQYKNIEFHFIGNKLKSIQTKNIIYHSPLSGKMLSKQLNSNHIYLTASINEPAGMHHIEGALCGLPLLYRESGALTEYCKNYGVGFTDAASFQKSLKKIINNYHLYQNKMIHYNNTANKMCSKYYELFSTLIQNKADILQQREKYIYSPLFKRNIYFKLLKFRILSMLNLN